MKTHWYDRQIDPDLNQVDQHTRLLALCDAWQAESTEQDERSCGLAYDLERLRDEFNYLIDAQEDLPASADLITKTKKEVTRLINACVETHALLTVATPHLDMRREGIKC